MVNGVDYRLGGLPQHFIGPRDLMRIPDAVTKCVAFVGSKDHDRSAFIHDGTAFFVRFNDPDHGESFTYLVTARHVIDDQARKAKKRIHVRLNLGDGTSREVSAPGKHWHRHPDEKVDLAVLPWPEMEDADFDTIEDGIFVSDGVIQQHGIGIGDETFMTGLLANHAGNKQIRPIVRKGSIAMMPLEPIGNRGIDAYLLEVHSMGGLSGCPAFVRVHPGRLPDGQMNPGYNTYYLLGITQSHFNVKKGDGVNTVPTREQKKPKVNSGIALVVPATKILDVLLCDALKQQREEEIRARQE